MAAMPFDNTKRLDHEYVEQTAKLIIEAYRRDGKVPNFDRIHRDAKMYARDVLKFSDKGARAWASLKCEELRRWLVAQIAEI